MVIEVPEPVRSEVLAVRRIVSRTSQSVPVGIGSVGPLPPQDLADVRRILDVVGEETGPIIGRFVGLRRFPQTRYVYLAPDDELATSLLILQDRLVEFGLKLAPDVYQATPHAVIGRVPPEAELEVAAGRARPRSLADVPDDHHGAVEPRRPRRELPAPGAPQRRAVKAPARCRVRAGPPSPRPRHQMSARARR